MLVKHTQTNHPPFLVMADPDEALGPAVGIDQIDDNAFAAAAGNPPGLDEPGRPYINLPVHVDLFHSQFGIGSLAAAHPDIRASSDHSVNHDRRKAPLSRISRPVNRLSSAAIRQLVQNMKDEGRLVEVQVRTGDSRFNRTAYLSRFRGRKVTGEPYYAQVTPYQGSLAEADLRAWHNAAKAKLEENGYQGDDVDQAMLLLTGSATPPSSLNLSHIMWRYLHPTNYRDEGVRDGFENPSQDIHYRLLVAGLEVSHRASAYDMYAWPPIGPNDFNPARRPTAPPGHWKRGPNRNAPEYPYHPNVPEGTTAGKNLSAPVPGWRVELSELESADVQASRSVCASHALMWFTPEGQLIPVDAEYTGPTMCPHHVLYGTPCYGPHPSEVDLAAEIRSSRQTGAKGREIRTSGQAAPESVAGHGQAIGEKLPIPGEFDPKSKKTKR